MKKIKRIIIIQIIIIIMFAFLCTVNASNIWNVAQGFLRTGREKPGMTTSSPLQNILGETSKSKFAELIDFIWGLGLLTIFISTVILGMKYMFVNPAEKSRIKQATTPYIVGVTVIFGALTIWKFVIIILDGSL